MLRVGLTGGLATGKTFVGEALAKLGCRLIKADELGREALQPGGEAYQAVVEEFGPDILASDGAIDRRLLAACVFPRPERLAALNRLVHPVVIRRENELVEEIQAREPDAIVVVEAAVMIEAGSHTRFDTLVLTVCRPEQQIERAMQRDGVSREAALARVRCQMPLDEKRKYADFVIDTSGSAAETLRQVRQVYDSLRSMT